MANGSVLDEIWAERRAALGGAGAISEEDTQPSVLDELWAERRATGAISEEDTPPPSRTESALRGAAQGATFGFSDELAALPYLFPGGKTYRQDLEENRAIHEAARQANPGSYLAGEIGGAALSTAVPALGLLGTSLMGAGRAGKLGYALQQGLKAPLLSKAGIGYGAGAGGLYSAGLSEADSVSEFAGDVATGAALGAGGSAVLGGAGRVIHGTPVYHQAVKTLRGYGIPLSMGQQYPGLAPLEDLIAFSPASGVKNLKGRVKTKVDDLNKLLAQQKDKYTDIPKNIKELTQAKDIISNKPPSFVERAIKDTGLNPSLIRGAGAIGAGSQIGLLPTAGAISLPWIHRGVSALNIPLFASVGKEIIDKIPQAGPYAGLALKQLPDTLRFNIPAIGLQ